MKITVIGTGYVGLVSGACLSAIGHEVACFDKDRDKIDRIRRGDIPIYEPGLDELVGVNVAAGRLSFAVDLDAALHGAEAIFIAVGTPARPTDGHADLSFVYEAADSIAAQITRPCVVICKSTVPVGTNREILRRLRKLPPRFPVEVASNPEFLREGVAIDDFMRPDRVVVGADSNLARETLAAIYQPLALDPKAILLTDLESAELIKYAANAFLATKLSYINEIADLCEQVGANIRDVARGMGLDRRIGLRYLEAGPGYGGSCFPKDTRALLQTARGVGVPLHIVAAVAGVNDSRKEAMAARIVAALGGSAERKTVAVLGVTFKPNTDDMRESPSLAIIPALQAAGASVRAHDPEGMPVAEKMLSGVEWCDGPYHAAEGSDAVVIVTEWNLYRTLDLRRVKRLMRGRAFVDLRNIVTVEDATAAGLDHSGIGLGTAQIEFAPQQAAE